MATLGTGNITYRDVLAGLKGDKSRDADIVELFVEENPILDDLIVNEANDGSANLTTIRAGLPSVSWTSLYEGVQPSKGGKRQVKDASGRAESLIEVDKRLYDRAPDKSGFMLDEARSHAEAMGQDVATALFYGNIASNPKQFNGLAMRYPEHGGTDKDLSNNYVLSGSSNQSTSALRSIWLVGHSTKSAHLFYPQGTVGGLQKSPLEDDTVEDSSGGKFKVKQQFFYWDVGLSVKDFRYCGRISNIESDKMFDSSGVPDYLELVRRLVIRVKAQGVKQSLYMDRMVLEMLNVVASRKTQANAIQTDDLFGRRVTTVYGIPVRICDALEVNEDATTAAS